MIFETKVAGIPCQCEVVFHSKASPMRITGTGFGDAEPPELEDIEFDILDRRGRKAPWLSRKMTQADDYRLREEFNLIQMGERFGYL